MLGYGYTAGTNKLASVSDGGNQDAGATPHAYQYDADGAFVNDTQQINSSVGYHEVVTTLTLDRRKLPTYLAAQRTTYAGDPSGDYYHTATYRYSASGERYWKSLNGSAEYYVLGASAVGREQQVGVFTGSSGNTLRHWNILTPSGEAVGRIPTSGSRQYYVKDHLGSTRAVVNETNGVVERHDYDALLRSRRWSNGPTGARNQPPTDREDSEHVLRVRRVAILLETGIARLTCR